MHRKKTWKLEVLDKVSVEKKKLPININMSSRSGIDVLIIKNLNKNMEKSSI